MATIITRETGATAKNSPLTNAELDANFVNLNTAKLEIADLVAGRNVDVITASGKTTVSSKGTVEFNSLTSTNIFTSSLNADNSVLNGITTEALHRSPNAVTTLFVYDTSKDSDGGAWTEKCQHTSWYNESLNGRWLGAQPSEIFARNEGATLGSNLFVNGDFSNGTTGWTTVGASVNFDGVVDGRAKIVVVSNFGAGSGNGIRQTVTTVIGKTYRVSANVESPGSGSLDIYVLNGAGVVSSSSKSGTVECFFSAASTSTEIRIGFNGTGEVIGDVGYVDNALIREAIATTQPGDYFQLTTDGKFYKLNATSGTTETFRGNKRDFPRLSAIVAEAANVTIYDLTEPGRPMWMRFIYGGGAYTQFFIGSSVTSIGIVNGLMCVGLNDGAYYRGHLMEASFISDKMLKRHSAYNQTSISHYGLKYRNTELAGFGYAAASATNIVINEVGPADARTNAIAMTVLPDAPVDPVTGLKVPTIAVATAGGVSVIKHDGTVVNSSESINTAQITLSPNILTVGGGSTGRTWRYAINPGTLGASFVFTGFIFQGGSSEWQRGIGSNFLRTSSRSGLAKTDNTNLLMFRRNNETSDSRAAHATITNTFNTGHMVGGIRRCFLADIDAGTAGNDLVTNGSFSGVADGTAVTTLAGWSAYSTPTNRDIQGEKLRITATAVSQGASLTVTTVVGKRYVFSVTATGDLGAAGIYSDAIGDVSTVSGNVRVAFTATATSTVFFFRAANNAAGTTYYDNISVVEAVADRSYKAQSASITGTLTKTPVALGSQLVAYSGFSS